MFFVIFDHAFAGQNTQHFIFSCYKEVPKVSMAAEIYELEWYSLTNNVCIWRSKRVDLVLVSKGAVEKRSEVVQS